MWSLDDVVVDAETCASGLPPELLQLLGAHLGSADLRNARLCCKPWATALAHCMPTVTMSLPKQTSERVFRQPLVLGSTNDSLSRAAHYFSAMPRAAPGGRKAAGGAAKPNPFATRGGQAAARNVDCAGDLPPPLPAAGLMHVAASLPAGALARITNTAAAASAAAASAAPRPGLGQLDDPSPPSSGGLATSWSSLPACGLRTCSSLQQLNLMMSGAPPSPQDLLDLAALHQLTHLSFRQVDPAPLAAAPAAAPAAGAAGSGVRARTTSTSSSRPRHSLGRELEPLIACMSSMANAAAAAARQPGLRHNGTHSSGSSMSRSSRSSYASAGGAADAGGSSSSGCVAPAAGACSCLLLATPSSSSGDEAQVSAMSDWGSDDDDTRQQLDQQQSSGSTRSDQGCVGPAASDDDDEDEEMPDAVRELSVITAHHVDALAQLPGLSSLDLAPSQGRWDAAASDALRQLSKLTGLRKLRVTWGDAAAAAPLSDAAAVGLAHGEQLPLQQCLAGLTALQELELRGRPVVDVQLLQQMRQLRVLKGEALRVVNSDVLARLQGPQGGRSSTAHPNQHQQQQQDGAAAAALVADAAGAGAIGGEPADAVQAAGGDQQQAAVRRSPKWAVLPCLEELEVTHPASDISEFLQGTQTPNLRHMGFVSCSSSDFSRLLGQHGKLQTLQLAFRGDESWHPIAVVRLPTALPSLRRLSLSGSFWLPNSLIVGLGVMEVPLEELTLACKLAPACLERLQHLRQLRKLALHHVPWTGHVAEGLASKDVMLQLPAKLLPPQLAELEITNGWILQ